MPRRMSRAKDDERMTTKQYLGAVWKVLKISYSISKSSILFKIANAVIDSIFPLLTAFFAAQTTTQIAAAFSGVPGAKTKALWYVAATAGLGLITAILMSLGNYVDQIVRFTVQSRISDMLYERFASLDFWRYDDKKTGDLYDKAQDFSSFFAYAFDRVTRLFQQLFSVLSALVGLAFITPWLSLLLLGAILPGMYVQYRLSRFQIKHWRANVVERRKQSFIEYNMIQPKTIPELRLYDLAKTFLNMRIEFRNKDEGGRLEFEKSFIKWRILSDALETLVQLGSLIWVVLQIGARLQPIGQFVYIQQLVGRVLSSAGGFITEFGATDEDLAKLKDYNDFMELPITQIGGRKIKKPIQEIRFENVSFTYPNTSKQVMSDVNLTITRGSHVAIVGENGAGKSTLIKLLLGFYQPTSGVIYLDNIPLLEYDIASWHAQIGVLLQEFATYQFATVGDNVTFGNVSAVPTKDRISKALAAAQAQEVIDGLPSGLDTPAATWFEDGEGVQLSGGQWQRIGLARNFYLQAPVTILDEPTSAIDALAEANIFDRLFSKTNKDTVITISHRLTTIENADIIFVFRHGRIVQQGTHKELAQQKKGEYAHMFRRQLKDT